MTHRVNLTSLLDNLSQAHRRGGFFGFRCRRWLNWRHA